MPSPYAALAGASRTRGFRQGWVPGPKIRRWFERIKSLYPPLVPKAPIDGTARRSCRPHADQAVLERGSPWHQLEAQTIVNNREPARCQRNPLSVGAGEVFAVGGGMVREAGSVESGDRVVEMAPAQGLEEIAGKDNSLTLTSGQAVLDR